MELRDRFRDLLGALTLLGALAVDAMVDPTPVLVAAITALTPQDR